MKSFNFKNSLINRLGIAVLLLFTYGIVSGQDTLANGVDLGSFTDLSTWYVEVQAFVMYAGLEILKMLGIKKTVPKFFWVVLAVAVMAIIIMVGAGFAGIKDAFDGVVGAVGIWGIIKGIGTLSSKE